MIAAPLLTGMFGLYLGQDANWDLRNYHWYNAYALVNGRFGFDLLPSQLPYFYNPALDVPFFLLASHLPARIAGFILAAVQGLNFMLLFMLSYAALIIPSPRQKVLLCTILAAVGMFGAGGIAQIGTTFYDNITSLGVFLSILLTLRLYPLLVDTDWKRSLGLAILCGFPAGLMMGLKLPAVIFCIGLCGALLFTAGSLQRRVWISFGFGIGVLLGLTLSLGPWAFHLYTQYGNPLFPYFNNIFQSSLAPIASARDVTFLPENWFDRLLFPFIFSKNPFSVGEIPWRDLRLPLWYFLLPACLALRGVFRCAKNPIKPITAPVPTRYLLWAAGLSYVAWIFLFAIYRYIISLEMLAPLLIVMTLGLLPLRTPIRAALASLVMGTVLITLQPGNWGRAPQWLDRTVSIDRPELEGSANLMMLMAGFEPYSHVITEFPPHIPFIRIQSNFTSPENGMGINQRIKDRVNKHTGPYKILIPKDQLLTGSAALQYFDLTLSPKTCRPVQDHLFDADLALCDVQPTHNLAVTP
ncbi:MAG: hypothetical protein JZU50_04665 [Desulfobulbaceae bacterium]|nr:hypothetical protein [Desulfobulbaceae bacterium]